MKILIKGIKMKVDIQPLLEAFQASVPAGFVPAVSQEKEVVTPQGMNFKAFKFMKK